MSAKRNLTAQMSKLGSVFSELANRRHANHLMTSAMLLPGSNI